MKIRFEFEVIDKNTGKPAEIENIALYEEWAKGLCWCDMEQFAIGQDGTLYLLDECGRYEYAEMPDRFEIIFGTVVER